MKKKIIFSNCIFLLSLLACTNELKEETSSLNTIPIDVINLEEAFPNKTKETVTLQNGISFERYNDLIIWGGDMIISEKMFNSFNNPTQTRGGIVNNPDFKWPNGIVYYKFDSAISKTTKEHIQQAMDEWKQSTSKIITFTERTSQKNYIKFINEFDREIFALACANMLIHKDGKTNLEQLDTRTDEACEWIKDKKITKVLMNPPYERKYGCLKIVDNVLKSVPIGTKCAFILPDKKLEKDYIDKKYGNKLLKNNTLTTIIKLPENLFFGVGVTTSIFVFEAGKPQNMRNIIGYYIEEDGLETVKNQGRQDIKERWQEKEDYWIGAIRDGEDSIYGTRQIINPLEHISYQMPTAPFEIFEEDFVKTMMDYEMFQRGIDVKDFNEKVMKSVLYSSTINENSDTVIIEFSK